MKQVTLLYSQCQQIKRVLEHAKRSTVTYGCSLCPEDALCSDCIVLESNLNRAIETLQKNGV